MDFRLACGTVAVSARGGSVDEIALLANPSPTRRRSDRRTRGVDPRLFSTSASRDPTSPPPPLRRSPYRAKFTHRRSMFSRQRLVSRIPPGRQRFLKTWPSASHETRRLARLHPWPGFHRKFVSPRVAACGFPSAGPAAGPAPEADDRDQADVVAAGTASSLAAGNCSIAASVSGPKIVRITSR